MAGSRVPKPSHIDEALRTKAQHLAKAAGTRVRTAEASTPEREALEHPHILFSMVRDPLVVAMSARWLNVRGGGRGR
jgi:hypothetical protein